MNQAPREFSQPSWCRRCGIPHPADARACLHCGLALSGVETDGAVPGALAPPATTASAKRTGPLSGRRAAKPIVDVEAEAAAIVARAMAIEAAASIAAPGKDDVPIAVPPPLSSLAGRPRYFPVTERTVLQRGWLIAGILLCVLLIAFALLIARNAAMLPR